MVVNSIHWDVAGWPWAIKTAACLGTCAVIAWLGYWIHLLPMRILLDQKMQQEQHLKQQLMGDMQQTNQLTAYQHHTIQSMDYLTELSDSIFGNVTVEELLEEIAQIASRHHLAIHRMLVGEESGASWYHQRPIQISLVGDFHAIKAWFNDVAVLPYLVTVHDITLHYPQGAMMANRSLVADVTVNIYRYQEVEG